ncbi:hypothetical protein [Rothia sp. ZJ932]|uniref:hypothetical protein n=1 Tax=Rothia sp. ZJ932 TaxID=2810516 RepID=UPI0019673594|nr:hypothetical protein [Rothia sp. ZJ932]QRZ62457.1 hypothetical protein JR346_05100 [Rothia sp. ZJ932]
MNHTRTSLLTALPYPLLAGTHSAQAQVAHWRPPSTPSTIATNHSTFESSLGQLCLDDLVNLASAGIAVEEHDVFARELGLVHLHGSIYVEQNTTVTARHRALAVSLQFPEVFSLYDGRISRSTASWVWGFTTACPVVHIDFNRHRRANIGMLERKGIIAHQINFHLYDDLTFNGIRCATPLRTVADMLIYDPDASEAVVPYILAHGVLGCTVEKVRFYLRQTPYLKYKKQGLARLLIAEKIASTLDTR